jgi:hypothetical protein
MVLLNGIITKNYRVMKNFTLRNNKIIISFCLLILVIMLVFQRCNHIPSGYIKYRTFDEYSLKGIDNWNWRLKIPPYVAIRTEKDTINVIIYYLLQKNKYLKYVNKGNCWYNLTIEQIDPKLYATTKCDTVPHYCEKFIYNDTILRYNYYLEQNNKKTNEGLEIETRNNIIYISPENFDLQKKNNFILLKNLICNYKTKYPYFEPIHQKCYFHYYNKLISGDTLSIYENDGKHNYRLGCLHGKYLLNSLGEIDNYRLRSIHYNWKAKGRCQ